jgi:hypothetical protein
MAGKSVTSAAPMVTFPAIEIIAVSTPPGDTRAACHANVAPALPAA